MMSKIPSRLSQQISGHVGDIVTSNVALPSHAIPSPASAAARWRWTWWGRCRPWLSLLLTWSKKFHFRRVSPIVSPPPAPFNPNNTPPHPRAPPPNVYPKACDACVAGGGLGGGATAMRRRGGEGHDGDDDDDDDDDDNAAVAADGEDD